MNGPHVHSVSGVRGGGFLDVLYNREVGGRGRVRGQMQMSLP